MKSIVDKLSSRLEQVENTSGNTSGFSKDEVTQLIKDTVDTSKFATKDELSGYASSSHTHDEITNRISETINDDEFNTNIVTVKAVRDYVNTRVEEILREKGVIQ